MEEANRAAEDEKPKQMQAVLRELLAVARMQGLIRDEGGSRKPNVCCLIILDNNKRALWFWENLFERLGYKPCKLRDVKAADEHCTQYGFAVAER